MLAQPQRGRDARQLVRAPQRVTKRAGKLANLREALEGLSS